MTILALFKWVFLWIASSVAMLVSVVNFHNFYKNVDGFNNHLFWGLISVSFIYYMLLSKRGISWVDYVSKLIPVSWIAVWLLIRVYLNAEFPYSTALWLLFASTLGFGVAKWNTSHA